ncbi:MAG: thiamine-monophosphate kinase [Phycisphaeraceae bacterium]|nr:MAG: thiamine-monophosphate kinase [Phycisphaeraceae bacterium]
MRESELHAHIRDLAAGMTGSYPRVLLGPGDDCAVVRTGSRSVLTVDQVVEGRHFAPGTAIDLIARKAVARSISDLAAMACRPVCALATGLLPSGYGHARELTERLHHWANRWSCPIVGGDIATSPAGTPLSLTVTALGELREDEPPITRAGARPGDDVYVTGALGGSLASGRHLVFEPRVEDALWLRATLGTDLTSMIDLSDGLGRDGARIAVASGVIVEVDAASLPLHAGTGGWQHAIGDGEDYELLFTVRRSLGSVARSPYGTPLTRIGRVVALGSDRSTSACIVHLPDGTVIDASEMGWDHT